MKVTDERLYLNKICAMHKYIQEILLRNKYPTTAIDGIFSPIIEKKTIELTNIPDRFELYTRLVKMSSSLVLLLDVLVAMFKMGKHEIVAVLRELYFLVEVLIISLELNKNT